MLFETSEGFEEQTFHPEGLLFSAYSNLCFL